MVCLLSTVHDPGGNLAQASRDYLPVIERLYESCVYLATNQTHPDTLKALGRYAVIAPTDGMANARRMVLNIGLSGEARMFHYCDFDRILFWTITNLNELKWLIEWASKEDKFVILQRTPGAFTTHPPLQRLTEWIVNRAFSNGRYIDYLSGSRIIPARLASEILCHSRVTNGAAIDIEWPAIVGPGNITHWTVNGLGYEHRIFGIEKPPLKEASVRIDNMFSALRLKWSGNGLS